MKGTKDILLEKIRSGVAMGALVGTASGIIAGGAIGFLSNGLKTSSPEIVSYKDAILFTDITIFKF